MSGRRIAWAAALVAVAACDGYRLVEPEPPIVQFGAHVQITHDDSARYVLRAFFQGPRDVVGVHDEAILVDGVRVEPSSTGPSGLMQYEWRETRSASDPRTDALVVCGPEVREATAAIIPLPLLARRDGAALPRSDEDLRLGVIVPSTSGTLERRDASWMLNGRESCGEQSAIPHFTLFVDGSVPPELRIPRSLLPDPLPSPFEICLQASHSYVAAGAPYPASAGTIASLVWRVTP